MNQDPVSMMVSGGMINGEDIGLPPGPWQMEPCKSCNSPMFDQRFIMMHQSMIVASDGKDKTALHPIMTCSQCGWVHGSPVQEKEPPTVENMPDDIRVFEGPPTLEARGEEPPPQSDA